MVVDEASASVCFHLAGLFIASHEPEDVPTFSTTAFCRSAFDRVGGFSPKAGWAADWDLWMRLILDGGAAATAGVPGGLYNRSRGAWSTAAGSPRELEWMKMWVDHRRREWPTDVIEAMDLSLRARSERIGRLLLDERDSASLDLLATAAALGSKTAARRLRLERYPVVGRLTTRCAPLHDERYGAWRSSSSEQAARRCRPMLGSRPPGAVAHAVRRHGRPSGRPNYASEPVTDLYPNVTTHSTYRCIA